MTRQRDYRDQDYDFDDRPPYRDRPPSNRRPPRRYEEDEYDYEEMDDRPHYRGRPQYHESAPRRDYERPPRPMKQRPDSRRAPYRTGPPPQYRNARPADDYDARERGAPPQRPRTQRPDSQGAQTLQVAKKSTNRKIFLFIYNLFFYTLTIGILLSSLMFAFSEKSDAAIFGYRFYQVLTDSMASQPDSPSKGFYSGDIVLVKMTDGRQVKEGDVVTFQVGEGNRYLTHRMVERLTELNGKEGDYIVTKGDANESNDPPIEASRVYGKVTFVIPKMGSILNFVQENLWLCLVCVLSTFGFFLVLKAYFLQPDPVQEPYKRKRYPNRV
ncbi:signal peptidase I [Enterococcus sp. 669A]|uniref:Signal peptidase I n=1 Tax=Candidatus Enterococcus moelleringii TaxID=2815325 RepID=A0ABS3LGX0_9ENTE|nr:signal peptidase I [Enterococcus sp. 669A]MBO1308886.1 signal peptidase I [Enterococcus sp. 669A]